MPHADIVLLQSIDSPCCIEAINGLLLCKVSFSLLSDSIVCFIP